MNLAELRAQLLDGVGEVSSSSTRFYADAEANDAINSAQRLFVLMTLCLETTLNLQVRESIPTYTPLSTMTGWILPLSMRSADGTKIRPATLGDFAAMDVGWMLQHGPLQRYASVGFNLLCFYPCPLADQVVSVTFARCPVLLVGDSDVPEIPSDTHGALARGGQALLQLKEGAQEFTESAGEWEYFLESVNNVAERVRRRGIELGYDQQPFELNVAQQMKVLRKAVHA